MRYGFEHPFPRLGVWRLATFSAAFHIAWAEIMVAFVTGILVGILGEILRYLRLIHESADEIKKALQAQESQDES